MLKPCLNMIVRNEAANIERCLASVAPHISCWVIGDTGSTDGTQELIRSFFASRGIPGELHAFGFQDFAQARNEALRLARRSSLTFDYLLLCDADMELSVSDPNFHLGLSSDLHLCQQRSSDLSYWNVRLVRRDCAAIYHGVTHEFIGGEHLASSNITGISFLDHATGSSRPIKHERDARLLRKALETEADPGMKARYTFYLANTLREVGDLEEALSLYLQRSKQGQWQEEVYMSLLHAGNIRIMLGHGPEQVLSTFDDATTAAPWRAEALHAAARYCRERNEHGKAYEFSRRGLGVPYPQNSLFVLNWIYDYGLLDEFAISAYWTGHYDESLTACDRLLSEGLIPPHYRDRIAANAGYARAHVQAASPPRRETDGGSTPARTDAISDTAGADAENAKPEQDEARALYDRLAAYDARPDDLDEVLALTRQLNQRRLHNSAVVFAERALAVHRAGAVKPDGHADARISQLQQEFSIAAYYSMDAATRQRGFDVCNALALDRHAPLRERGQARKNIRYYAGRASELFPSMRTSRPVFVPPQGYAALNPSIATRDGELVMIMRCVNYRLQQGRYVISDAQQSIRTRNFLMTLDERLEASSCREVLPPANWPSPAYSAVLGFEDLRLIPRSGELWVSGTVRELNPDGWCEIVLARLEAETGEACRLTDWRPLRREGEKRHEKNWTPVLDGDQLRFIYTYDPALLVNGEGHDVAAAAPKLAVDHFRGGSQAIPFGEGYLSVVHEVIVNKGERTYLHRFVQTDGNGVAVACSKPFYFLTKGIEFAAGLARSPHSGRLIVSFGLDDGEAWLAEFTEEDLIRGVDHPCDAAR